MSLGRWLSSEKGKKGRGGKDGESEGGPDGLLLSKTQNRFQPVLFRDKSWALRGPRLTSRGLWLGEPLRSGIQRPQMQNSGARTVPKADLCWFRELCFSCLLHQVSSYPDGPPGDRPPHPSTLRVQPMSFRGCAHDPWAWRERTPVTSAARPGFPGREGIFMELKS